MSREGGGGVSSTVQVSTDVSILFYGSPFGASRYSNDPLFDHPGIEMGGYLILQV